MTRKRMIAQGGQNYHIYNRFAGDPKDFAMHDTEKEKFIDMANTLLVLHSPSISLLGYCIMGGHYHMVVHHNPSVKISKNEAESCFTRYYDRRNTPTNWVAEEYDKVVKRITALSSFVGVLQQQFATWMNKVSRHSRAGYDYRGHVWAERYKSPIITTPEGTQRCIIYAAFNPLRAGIVKDIGSYRHSSWGVYKQTGHYPHADALAKYFIVDQDETKSDKVKLKEALIEMERMITERILEECSLSEEEKNEAFEEALKGPGILKTVTKRVNFWTEGMIIGSKIANMEVAAEFYDKKKLESRKFHHFGKGETLSVFHWTMGNEKAELPPKPS